MRSALTILLITFLYAFSGNKSDKNPHQDFTQDGIASYYAQKFEGRLTANGERFSNTEYTCAHKTLPFGTKLKVTNLNNNKSIVVRVNDRGPFIKGRIIDLSKIAAQEIGMVQKGIVNVHIEIYHPSKKNFTHLNDTVINSPMIF